MLANRDIDTVDMYLAGNRDSELLAAWNRIKTELAEGQKPTTNTGSPKLPTLEECQDAFAVDCSDTGHVTADEYAAIQFVYDYICRQLQAGA